MEEWAIVAKLTKANNRAGGLSAQSVEGLPFLLSKGMEAAFVPPKLRCPRSAKVADVREGAKGALVFFDGIDDPKVSHELAGCYCMARTSDLPKGWDEPEWPPVDGYAVYISREEAPENSCSPDEWKLVGRIAGIEENPAHPLMQVVLEGGEGDGGEALVPLVDEFIASIDDDARAVYLVVPKGLLPCW